jgi:hypothetical protein
MDGLFCLILYSVFLSQQINQSEANRLLELWIPEQNMKKEPSFRPLRSGVQDPNSASCVRKRDGVPYVPLYQHSAAPAWINDRVRQSPHSSPPAVKIPHNRSRYPWTSNRAPQLGHGGARDATGLLGMLLALGPELAGSVPTSNGEWAT